MALKSPIIAAALVSMLAIVPSGCQAVPFPITRTIQVSTSLSAPPIPVDVQRLAVVHPPSRNRDYLEAYHRLEGAVFNLKTYRSSLRILDRVNLPALITELRFQSGGAVDDDTALHVGRLLGADSILLCTIEGPTPYEHLMARHLSQVPPMVITTKIIRVESAEVVYEDVVIAEVAASEHEDRSLSNLDYVLLKHEALERSITQTVMDLQHAFQRDASDSYSPLLQF
jgi:hypothetical protein